MLQLRDIPLDESSQGEKKPKLYVIFKKVSVSVSINSVSKKRLDLKKKLVLQKS